MVCPKCINSKDHSRCVAVLKGNPQLCDCAHMGTPQQAPARPASEPVTHHSELQIPETGANRAPAGDSPKNLSGPRYLRFGK